MAQTLIRKDIWFNDEDGGQSRFTFYHHKDATWGEIDGQVKECCKALMRSTDEIDEVVDGWSY